MRGVVSAGLGGLCILVLFGGAFYGGVEMLWAEGDPLMLGIACFGIGYFTAFAGLLSMKESGMTNYSALVYERSKEEKAWYEIEEYTKFIRSRRVFCVGLVLFLGGLFIMLKYD